jgi:hypothetical protein
MVDNGLQPDSTPSSRELFGLLVTDGDLNTLVKSLRGLDEVGIDVRATIVSLMKSRLRYLRRRRSTNGGLITPL